MALPSFTGQTPAATRGFLLHINGAALSNAPVYTGDGYATPLSFVTGGILVDGDVEATSGTFTSMTVGGVDVKASVWKVLTGFKTAIDTTPVAMPDLSFTPVSGAMYEVEMMLICQSASTGAGVQIVNTGGAGALTLAGANDTFAIVATGGTYAPTSSPVAGAKFVQVLKGIFTASSTAALTWSVKSETTDDVTIYDASYAKYTRLS